MKYLKAEIYVGIFMLLGIISCVIMALKVAGLVLDSNTTTYTLHASFENIGSLRVRAPVRIGGVTIGRVENIHLDASTLTPVVDMAIESQYNTISSESKASIQTAGLIGEQYISITPGFYDEDLGTTYLKDGDSFTDTGSAVVLEELLGKFLYNTGSGSDYSNKDENSTK